MESLQRVQTLELQLQVSRHAPAQHHCYIHHSWSQLRAGKRVPLPRGQEGKEEGKLQSYTLTTALQACTCPCPAE